MRDLDVSLSANRISDTYARPENTRRDQIWSRLAHLFKRWRKRRRDRADLAAMNYQQLEDIGFASTADSSGDAAGKYRNQAVLCARSDRLKEIIDRESE
jgi:uncharacterized protein YjiS (DUF1127 family)